VIDMTNISVKIELKIGEAVHLLTMEELRELRKVIDELASAPSALPAYPTYPTYPTLFKDAPFKPYWSDGTGDVIPDPWKVIC